MVQFRHEKAIDSVDMRGLKLSANNDDLSHVSTLLNTAQQQLKLLCRNIWKDIEIKCVNKCKRLTFKAISQLK